MGFEVEVCVHLFSISCDLRNPFGDFNLEDQAYSNDQGLAEQVDLVEDNCLKGIHTVVALGAHIVTALAETLTLRAVIHSLFSL